MRTRLLVLAILFGSACSGGAGNGLYLQFETAYEVDTIAFAGSLSPRVFKDRLYSVASNGLWEVTATGMRQVDGFFGAVVSGDGNTMYALKGDGSVWQSTDGDTFTQASPGPFRALGATRERLLAMRRDSFGKGTVLQSRDAAVTWTELGPVAAGFENGDTDAFSFTPPAGLDIRLSVQVSQAGEGITHAASQVYDLRGDVLELVGAYRGTDPIFPPPFPNLMTADGLALFTEADQPDQPADATSLVAMTNPGRTPDVLNGGRRVHWASPVLADGLTPLRPIGLDSQGRLLVVGPASVLRTVRPLTAASDDRGVILKGPGCDRRNTFEPDVGTQPTSATTVKNESAAPILLRHIDAQMRWHKLGVVEPGATFDLSTTYAKATHGLLATDPATDVCLLFQQLGEQGEVVVR